jgi:2-oxoglutarate ferredoxin oxidoreductase subunit alpha
MLVVEMNAGQMYTDVKLAVDGLIPVEFYGRLGGVVPFPDEILGEIRRVAAGPITGQNGHTRQRCLERLSILREGK